MEGGMKWLDLVHQRVGDALACDDRDAGNVVDRLFRIKFSALAADLVENVDKVRLDVEQAKLEHREQADWARADDQHIGLDCLTHYSSSHCSGRAVLLVMAGLVPAIRVFSCWTAGSRGCPA